VFDTLAAVGSLAVGKLPIDPQWLMDEQIQPIGSAWFTSAERYEMVELIHTGIADPSIFEHEIAALGGSNKANFGIGSRHGGFRNYVIAP
jgi:alcohol dehydrogenase